MIKYLLVIFFLLQTLLSVSQVVNIERKRLDVDSSGTYGKISASVLYIKNTKKIWNSSLDFNVVKIKEKHQWYFIGKLNMQIVEATKIVNKGYKHIRYNYRLLSNERLFFEVFEQLQFDAIRKIEKRFLFGTGIRYSPVLKRKFRISLGIGPMYEYETFNGINTYYSWLRLNSYFFVKAKVLENIFLYSTTYYQPLFSAFKANYRVFNNTGISFSMNDNFSFFVDYEVIYDTFLPINVPEKVYNLKNGLSYNF